MAEAWSAYVHRVAAGLSQKDVADRTGIDQTGVSRWLRGQAPSADNAVTFARHFNRPPVEALIAAGYLTPADVGAAIVEVVAPLADMSTDELMEQIRQLWIELERRRKAMRRSDRTPPCHATTDARNIDEVVSGLDESESYSGEPPA